MVISKVYGLSIDVSFYGPSSVYVKSFFNGLAFSVKG